MSYASQLVTTKPGNLGRLDAIVRDETTTIRFAGICDWPRLPGLVGDAGKLRRLSCSQDDFIYFLPVAATSLRAGCQVYLSKLLGCGCYQSSAIRFVDILLILRYYFVLSTCCCNLS